MCSRNVDEKEDMLVLVAVKETSRDADVENVLNTVLANASLPPNKLVSQQMKHLAVLNISTGLVGLLKSDPKFQNVFQFIVFTL
jgi:hypothetical protein